MTQQEIDSRIAACRATLNKEHHPVVRRNLLVKIQRLEDSWWTIEMAKPGVAQIEWDSPYD